MVVTSTDDNCVDSDGYTTDITYRVSNDSRDNYNDNIEDGYNSDNTPILSPLNNYRLLIVGC